jgi:riboflavin biosynthesis pyrimidine reductase
MLQISPAPEKVLSDSELRNLYPWPNKPWIRANMVQSLDGGVADQNGKTLSLSTESDKQIFSLLRQLCEVILVGSRTAQSAPYLDIKINEQNKELRKKLRLTKKPRLAVVSNNLNFTKEWFKSRTDEEQPIIYTSQSNDLNIRPFVGLAEFVFCGQKELDLKSVKQDLVRRSFKRILCEGGPTLLHGLINNNLLDELDLSIVAKFSEGSELTSLLNGSKFRIPIHFKPMHVLQDNQIIFMRYLTEGHKF